MLSIEETAVRAERVIEELERAVVGKREALELVLLGFLADGHVLIEDFPGLAKTLIARSLKAATASVTRCGEKRLRPNSRPARKKSSPSPRPVSSGRSPSP